MTLDEAIIHAEEVAEEKEREKQKWERWLETDSDYRAVNEKVSCELCAAEHRQLSEWLRKLKKYKEGIVQIKELINDYKGHDMWDTANGMQLALECLEGSDSE